MQRILIAALAFITLPTLARAQTPAASPAPAAAASPAAASTPDATPAPSAMTPAAATPPMSPPTPAATQPPGDEGNLPAWPGNLPAPQISLTTLELMHRKGLITDAEYAEALHDLAELGMRAKNENTLVVGRFATTMYGFAQADFIHDSTQSFLDLPGMGAIARPGTPAGELGRTMFSVRNSRIGFRIAAPEMNGIRSSGLLEMDFYGNQPSSPPKSAGYAESSFFTSPAFRVRHMLLKADTDIVNVWVGQTWGLVGWGGGFQPASMLSQGVPGELYARNPQLRIDKPVKAGPVTVEAAVAALRPPQMDSGVPDFQGGIKLSINDYKGVQSVGQTGTAISPAALAVSGGIRHFRLTDPETNPALQGVNGHIIAADVLVPIIPAKTRQPWALTFLGEAAWSSGYADQYTSLNGGAGVGAPKGISSTDYAKLADVDGMVGWSSVTHQLSTVDWRTLLVSAQLYLPPSGKLWLSGTYSNAYSDNIGEFGSSKAVFGQEIWWDAMVVADVTDSTRFGLEYDNYTEDYGDKVQGKNSRVMLTGLFIF